MKEELSTRSAGMGRGVLDVDADEDEDEDGVSDVDAALHRVAQRSRRGGSTAMKQVTRRKALESEGDREQRKHDAVRLTAKDKLGLMAECGYR